MFNCALPGICPGIIETEDWSPSPSTAPRHISPFFESRNRGLRLCVPLAEATAQTMQFDLLVAMVKEWPVLPTHQSTWKPMENKTARTMRSDSAICLLVALLALGIVSSLVLPFHHLNHALTLDAIHTMVVRCIQCILTS